MSRINMILFAIFGALCALLVVLEKPWAADRFDASSARVSRQLFENFDTTKAAAIEIRQGANLVQLKKSGAGWVIPSLNDFKANEDAVTRLLDRVHSMTRGDLVTNDAAQHDRYRVTEKDAPRVKISDASGAVLAEFFQGKPWFDMDNARMTSKINQLDCYIRATNSAEVYKISPFETVEPVRVNEWLPRNLFKFDIAAVQSLTIEGSGVEEPILLNQTGAGKWEISFPAGSAQAAKDPCETLVRSISSMYLQDVIGPYHPQEAAKFGFDKPAFSIKIALTGGTVEELLIGHEIPVEANNPTQDESAYAIGGISKTHVSKVFKSSLAALKVKRAQLLPPPESKPASAPSSQPAPPPVEVK